MAVIDSAKTSVGVCQNLINQINGVTDLLVPSTANTPVTPASIGMTANSTCKTAEELAILVTPLLMEKFRFKEYSVKRSFSLKSMALQTTASMPTWQPRLGQWSRLWKNL